MILTVIISLCLCQVLGDPIIRGHISDVLTYPWIASIHKHGIHYCGGSIISNTTILTAAHCVIEGPQKDYNVRVGSNKVDCGGSLHRVSEIQIHEGYNTTARKILEVINDVALMKVTPPIVFGDRCMNINLPNKKDFVTEGENVSVVGWGSTSRGGTKSNELRSVILQVVDNGICAINYGEKTGTLIKRRHEICASNFYSGPCYGDSGSPLVNEDNMIQYGIVSGGRGCANSWFPGIYQNVAYFRDWIDEHLRS